MAQLDLQNGQRWGNVFGTAPARMSIVRLDDPRLRLNAQFNPTELRKVLSAEWARKRPPGMSHQPMHYVGTDNVKFDFTLSFSAFESGYTADRIAAEGRFLESLLYSSRNVGNSPAKAQPSRCLFVWPKLLSLTAVLTSIEFNYNTFNLEGAPLRYTAKLSLEEIRDARLYADDVLSGGPRRDASAPEGV